MDIYDYLKMDHEKVAHLFKLFEKSNIEKRRQQIVELITEELLVHAHSEQNTFYKYLIQFPETAELAAHGEKEHREIENKISIVNHSINKKNWEEAVLKLKDIVDHHVSEEEGSFFAKAKEVLTEQDALVLKEKMHYLKGKFLIWLEKRKVEFDNPPKTSVSRGKVAKNHHSPTKKTVRPH